MSAAAHTSRTEEHAGVRRPGSASASRSTAPAVSVAAAPGRRPKHAADADAGDPPPRRRSRRSSRRRLGSLSPRPRLARARPRAPPRVRLHLGTLVPACRPRSAADRRPRLFRRIRFRRVRRRRARRRGDGPVRILLRGPLLRGRVPRSRPARSHRRAHPPRRHVPTRPRRQSLATFRRRPPSPSRAPNPGDHLNHPAFGVEERGALLTSVSPSGARRLVVRSGKDAGGDRDGVSLEIWEGGALVSEVLVPPKTHGTLCGDGTFGGVDWSAREGRVVYVAEAPRDGPTPEWGMGVTKTALEASGQDLGEDASTASSSKTKNPGRARGVARGVGRTVGGSRRALRVCVGRRDRDGDSPGGTPRGRRRRERTRVGASDPSRGGERLGGVSRVARGHR